jgi:hypothetical protein
VEFSDSDPVDLLAEMMRIVQERTADELRIKREPKKLVLKKVKPGVLG